MSNRWQWERFEWTILMVVIFVTLFVIGWLIMLPTFNREKGYCMALANEARIKESKFTFVTSDDYMVKDGHCYAKILNEDFKDLGMVMH